MAGIPFWLQNVIGNSARAGLIAAGSPTPGAVGTIRDAVGGLQAAEADQQQRMDRAMAMRRAALQEQRAMEQMEMEREQNDAMLAYRKAQQASEEAQRARALSQQKPPGGYIEFRKRALAEGITDEDQIMSAWMKQPYRSGGKPQASSEPKTPQQVAAQRLAKIDNYQKEPWLDPTGEGEKEDWAFIERVNRSNDPAPKPPTPQRPPSTAEGALVAPIYQRITDLEKLGTPQAMAEADKLRKELRGIMASKKSSSSGKPRYRIDTRKDGQRIRVDLDTGEVMELGYEKPPTGGTDASALINQWLNGGTQDAKPTKGNLTEKQKQDLSKKYGI